MEISACWKPLCLSSTSSSVLASVGARYLDSVISFSLWVRIRERVSSSLSLMKVLVLANEGAFKPHPKGSDSGERNLTAIVHQKFSPTFCILGILSITLVLHLHVCEVSFLKAQTRVSGISSITLGHLGLSSSGSSKPLWWKEDLFPFSVWRNSLEGIAYPVCLLKWSTVIWVGQAWFWYKKECLLLEMPGLRQHKACFKM